MSVASSYTDFHVDFGGTSVWLHVIKGEKVFFIIPPTPENLRKHERHLKNEDDKGFFGKSVDVCARVVLRVGDTFILPSVDLHLEERGQLEND
ncbi:unnamed protein product [Caenorhabditis auriculariae]|uniref:JmjC domain-containing protein n=1 Tax=Caenorhabditis auriculariae TaxID=2777116 RepID=A0A8S1HKM9_9PELO|nr:unnamed protein product [Caenorhabditis auriculariae]